VALWGVESRCQEEGGILFVTKQKRKGCFPGLSAVDAHEHLVGNVGGEGEDAANPLEV
jgi:hypothetical protein